MEKNNQILDYIKEVAEAKEVTEDVVIHAIEDAMTKAYEKECSSVDEKHPELSGEKCEVKIDKDTGKISFYKIFTVVDETKLPKEKDENGNEVLVYNDYNEMPLKEALTIDKNAMVGGIVREYIDINSLPKRVVLHILQVFKHDISIESNKSVYKNWINKKGEVILAEVEKVDARSKMALVNLGKTYGVVPRMESNPFEELIPGCKYKFVIKDVLEQTKGWPIILSRASGELVKDLLATNIPEINNGTITVVKVGRSVGFKTKVAVKSNQPGIDPIGACIGAKADRIKPILAEMGNEKIEFVLWDEDIGKFLVSACNPAPLYGYKVIDAVIEKDPETGKEKEVSRKKVILVVDEFKLALIIGLKGKNVRILSELFDADVEIMTIEEANEAKVDYIKTSSIRTPVDAEVKKSPTNKFAATYDKYRGSAMDVISQIDAATSSKQDDDTPVVTEGEKLSEEESKNYDADIAAINELTDDKK